MSARRGPIRPPPFSDGYRASGVLLHVTSLPSRYGIGDVGPGAMAWIDRLHESGQRWWQLLPVGPTGYGDSPYQALSSFAGNGLLLSLDWLIEDELLRPSDSAGRTFPADMVDYAAVIAFKQRLLDTLWARFREGRRPDLMAAFEEFGRDQSYWLDDYALFRALKAEHHGAYYLEWPDELVGESPRRWRVLGRRSPSESTRFASSSSSCSVRASASRRMRTRRACA